MKRLALGLGLILVLIAGIWLVGELMAGTGYPFPRIVGQPSQPVRFSHARHVGLGIECLACHTGARTGTHAGIPPTFFCAGCHRPARPSPPGTKPKKQAGEEVPAYRPAAPTPEALKRFLERNEEIPWLQLQRVPRHVFFSHRRHVLIAKLECAVCHGDMETRTEPVTEPVFPRYLPGMNRCVECHLEKNVSTDCNDCHH